LIFLLNLWRLSKELGWTKKEILMILSHNFVHSLAVKIKIGGHKARLLSTILGEFTNNSLTPLR
jgi:hypothetical protein